MRNILNSSLRIAIVFLISIAGISRSTAQDSKRSERVQKEADIKNMVASQNLVFKAQFALPMGGSSIPLTSEYDVRVTKDSIISFLPYFGRAYTAPLDPSEGGIRFTSTDFKYKENRKKKGGWDIVIRPNDVREVRELRFYISSSGYGSLQVQHNNRQPISFNGYYEKAEEKK